MGNVKTLLTLEEVKTLLVEEINEKTTKKDKKQVNQCFINCIDYLLKNGINTSVLLERTNTNRKNSKSNALHFNSGVLFEILINIAVDYSNGCLVKEYYKKPLSKVDININGVDYEIKLVSKYSLSAPQKNTIKNYIVGIIDNDGFTIKQLNDKNIEWHYCNEKQKDGTIKQKRQVALIQRYGIQRTDLMSMLGIDIDNLLPW